MLNKDYIGKINIYVYSFILVLLNFVRIFNNTYWADEIYSIEIIKNDIGGIIATTANDVHPPLYYLILKLFVSILGQRDYVYHLTSFLAYVVLIIFSCVFISKKFSKGTSLILNTGVSLSAYSLIFNVEVRMYSLASLFVILSFYYYYEIISENTKKSYILFVLFSLCAAYTHYYSLVSVAVFYGLLMIRAIINKKDIKKIIYVYISTILLYLPWICVLFNSLKRVSSEYWIENCPSFIDCLSYVFNNQSSLLFGLITLFGLVSFILSTKDKGFNKEIWMLVGIVSSILFTILVGIGISNLIRPLFIEKYVYPSSTLIWILMGYTLDNLRYRNIYVPILLICLLIRYMPNYLISTYKLFK